MLGPPLNTYSFSCSALKYSTQQSLQADLIATLL